MFKKSTIQQIIIGGLSIAIGMAVFLPLVGSIQAKFTNAGSSTNG